jgi:hypothetical protein
MIRSMAKYSMKNSAVRSAHTRVRGVAGAVGGGAGARAVPLP